MLKLIAKVIAGIILLLVVVIAGAVISMGAHVPDALYQPSPSAMVQHRRAATATAARQQEVAKAPDLK